MICIEKRYFIGIRKCINITVTAGILELNIKRQPHIMVKHAATILRNLPTNFLNEFDHFVWLALKALNIHR